MDSATVKKILTGEGASLCGIAPVDRFVDAPSGFHPLDIYEYCRSVVVFAKHLPAGTLSARSRVPYSLANDVVIEEVDAMGFRACLALEELGATCVPVPTDSPVEHWEEERRHGQGILSLRHAGMLAGLGVLGRNTLLINQRYGNMIQIGAILVDVELEGDPLASYETCAPDCGLCLESCPAGALDGTTVDQSLCRPVSIVTNARGQLVKGCYVCRRVCPCALGLA